MTHQPLTKAEREELRRLNDAASPAPWFVFKMDGYPNVVSYTVPHNGETLRGEIPADDADDELIAAARNALPRLLADLDAAEDERDEAVALIDAAKSDVRPESFLEHAQAILARCIAPYSCEQMKAVGDALAGCYRKWELMSEVALKAKEDADAMAKCKGCGGTVGDHLAPDQGGCPGSFEIDGVQMVPLSGRNEALAQRDRAESERDALKAKLDDPRRVLIHETEVVATKEEIAKLKKELADLSEADEELHACRALVNATSENLSVDLERMVDDLAEANEKAARSEKDAHSWCELYTDTKAKLAALVEVGERWVTSNEPIDAGNPFVDHDLKAAIAAARGGAS